MFAANIHRIHHHPGGAIAALQTMAVFKRGLHGVHRAVWLGQAFDRGDLSALRLCQQHITRFDRIAVHEDRAGTALRGVTAHVGASQVEVLAQRLDKLGVRCGGQGH